jgi:SOS-response transcriptional repressor LexA
VTPGGASVLTFVAKYLHARGYAPTFREIAEGVGLPNGGAAK